MTSRDSKILFYIDKGMYFVSDTRCKGYGPNLAITPHNFFNKIVGTLQFSFWRNPFLIRILVVDGFSSLYCLEILSIQDLTCFGVILHYGR